MASAVSKAEHRGILIAFALQKPVKTKTESKALIQPGAKVGFVFVLAH